MTSSMINPLPTMGFNLPKPRTAAAGSAAKVVQRGGSLVRVLITLSWLVGITGSFLTVGVIGMFADDLPPIHLKTLEDPEDAEMSTEELTMTEMMAMGEKTEDLTEVEPVVPVEIPETIETPPQTQDLPEIAEAMTLEDIFAVPTAPKIEDALRPVDPVVRQTPPAPARPRPGPVAKSKGTGASSSQEGTAGATGMGNSKGTLPKPPYPDFAQRAGMQGTVRLVVGFGPSGSVESVSVVSTTGFSALDEATVSFIRRNWRWQTGTSHRHTVPLTFRLN